MNEPKPTTLPEALLSLQGSGAADLNAIRYIQGKDEETVVSYRQLFVRAQTVLHHLRRAGVLPGSRLIIATSSNEQLLDGFWACQLGGITAVPLAVSYNAQGRDKFFGIYETLEDAFVFSDRKVLQSYEAFASEQGGATAELFKTIAGRSITAGAITAFDQTCDLHPAKPDDVALIQFSSGTTGRPKGVVLTHRNLLTNIDGIISAAGLTLEDSFLSWMPLTHDMGLIGFHLVPLVVGGNQYLMPSMLFARRPLLWLVLASRHGVSVLASPNFGYRHYLKAFEKEPGQDLDLSQVRLIFNGAETIAFEVVDRFCTALEPYRLDRAAIFPVYGLAEASLAVTFPKVHAALAVLSVDRNSLSVGEHVVCTEVADRSQRMIVGVGQAVRGCEFRLVNSEGEPVAEMTVGNIQIRGGSVTRGYYGSATARQESDWLDTGDLGFVSDQLFIVGRSKDTILVNGMTFHATDLEDICEQAANLAAGQVVCTSVLEDVAEKALVFVQHKGTPERFLATAEQVRNALLQSAGVYPEWVIPVRSIPRTSSGKVQRQALSLEFDRGAFSGILATLDELEAQADSGRKGTGRSELELLLLDICRRAITDTAVNVDDDLFDLGVSSLDLAGICEEIEDYFPGRLQLSDFLEYTSVEALAEFLQQEESAGNAGIETAADEATAEDTTAGDEERD